MRNTILVQNSSSRVSALSLSTCFIGFLSPVSVTVNAVVGSSRHHASRGSLSSRATAPLLVDEQASDQRRVSRECPERPGGRLRDQRHGKADQDRVQFNHRQGQRAREG